MKIGLISDTHGLVRVEALRALEGSDLIIHAGDIGSPDVLDALGALAPVAAIRGNIDKAAWAESLAETEVVEAEDALIYVLHDLKGLDLDPATARIHAVVAGHSHKPSAERKAGVLYVNPGSAGPRRFHLPIAVARMVVTGGEVTAEIVLLDAGVRAGRKRADTNKF